MKLIALAILALSSTLSFAADKVVPITDVYVPNSFDSSTEPYVVVQGIFMNTCYSLKEVKVNTVDASTQEISTIASVKEGSCFGDITPFHKEVKLGRLTAGDHVIRFLHGDGTYMEKKITIQ
jgi:hypothetical protein